MTDPAGLGGSAPEEGASGGSPSPGVVQSVRDLVGTLVAALQTRLQLLSADAHEAGWRLAAIVAFGIGALFCLFVGTVLFALLIIVAFWDRSPAVAVGLLSTFFLAASAGCAWLARRHVRMAPGLFAATLETLARDRDALGSGTSAAVGAATGAGTAAGTAAGAAAPR